MDYIIVNCPHCNDKIQIYLKEINCKIFRHGVYKHNYVQIDPHLPKDQCEKLKQNDLIYGCGKPYMLVKVLNKWEITRCDYK